MNCLAVIAHGGAGKTVNDFWPYWRCLGVQIVGFVPDGDEWPGTEKPHTVVNYGVSAHRGPHAFHRMLYTWKWLASSEFDGATIIEPDCIPIVPELPPIYQDAIGGWVCGCEPEMWSHALLPPWTGTRETFAQLAEKCVDLASTPHPDCIDYTDRWIHKAATLAGVRVRHINSVLGYAVFRNASEYIRRYKPTWLHGIKNKEQLVWRPA